MMLTAALLAAILASLVYRHTRPITFLNDTCQFLRAARKIRRERRFPGVLEYNLMDAVEGVEWDYPPLLILILALFQPGTVERHLRAFSIMNDLVCMAALGAMAWLVDGRAETGVLTMALYSFTPSVVVQRMMLTARFLSIALLTVSASLVTYYLASGAAWAAIVAVITGAALLVSNALAIQVWAFVILALAIFSPSRWAWLAYAGASLALCYLLAGRVAWRVHRGLVTKLWVLKKYRMDDIRIGQFHLLQKIRGVTPEPGLRLRRTLRILVRSILLIDYPFVWVLAVPVLFGANWAAPVDLQVWFGASLLCHLLIDSVPALRFIGPANRYLSYAFLPAGVMAARVVFDSAYSVAGIVILFSTMAVGLALAMRRLSLLKGTYDLDVSKMREIADGLRQLPVDRILVLPISLSDSLGYFSDKKFLHGWASRAWGVGPRYGIYPVMERPLDDVIEQFGLEAIVVQKDYARFEELKISASRKLLDNDDFEVYAVAAGLRSVAGDDFKEAHAASEYA